MAVMEQDAHVNQVSKDVVTMVIAAKTPAVEAHAASMAVMAMVTAIAPQAKADVQYLFQMELLELALAATALVILYMDAHVPPITPDA